ncbi:MAG: EscU/YscU/HrcU family type III secretion system export apparatus switch protein [Betaproteobacteria bacterium]|nr:EscU/YscU/HrcU family type III secretion system export apparatus switch protein [Betaproteobacteria bacterium]
MAELPALPAPLSEPLSELTLVPASAQAVELRTAVALTYPGGRDAPRVSAQGRGLIAEEIIRRAREAGVYVHESRELVSLLMQVDLDQHIPQQLYVAVAELLAWLHRLERGTQTP